MTTCEPEDAIPRRLTAEESLAFAFQVVEAEQYDLNRRAASRATGIAEALGWARSHPEIYALPIDGDPVRTAERCAAVEASARLNLAENAVRNLAYTADTAGASLPLLWAHAREGLISLIQVDAAVALLSRFQGHGDRVGEFDTLLADYALHSTPAAFRARAATLAKRLADAPEAQRHAEELQKRRMTVSHEADGMSWLGVYAATTDVIAIERRVKTTTKQMDKATRAGRTAEQIHADLLTAWLTGAGTPTAVKTKVFVTVPLDRLSKQAQASVRTRIGGAGVDLNAACQLVGQDDIDDVTARQLLLDTGAFTRVITDPVSGVILDMDLRARTVTRRQREWLTLTHGTCARDGCTRLAIDADVDHWCAFHGPDHGPTNIENLHPLCDSDHALRDTKLVFRRRSDLTIHLISPTGSNTVTARVLARRSEHDSVTPPF